MNMSSRFTNSKTESSPSKDDTLCFSTAVSFDSKPFLHNSVSLEDEEGIPEKNAFVLENEVKKRKNIYNQKSPKKLKKERSPIKKPSVFQTANSRRCDSTSLCHKEVNSCKTDYSIPFVNHVSQDHLSNKKETFSGKMNSVCNKQPRPSEFNSQIIYSSMGLDEDLCDIDSNKDKVLTYSKFSPNKTNHPTIKKEMDEVQSFGDLRVDMAFEEMPEEDTEDDVPLNFFKDKLENASNNKLLGAVCEGSFTCIKKEAESLVNQRSISNFKDKICDVKNTLLGLHNKYSKGSCAEHFSPISIKKEIIEETGPHDFTFNESILSKCSNEKLKPSESCIGMQKNNDSSYHDSIKFQLKSDFELKTSNIASNRIHKSISTVPSLTVKPIMSPLENRVCNSMIDKKDCENKILQGYVYKNFTPVSEEERTLISPTRSPSTSQIVPRSNSFTEKSEKIKEIKNSDPRLHNSLLELESGLLKQNHPVCSSSESKEKESEKIEITKDFKDKSPRNLVIKSFIPVQKEDCFKKSSICTIGELPHPNSLVEKCGNNKVGFPAVTDSSIKLLNIQNRATELETPALLKLNDVVDTVIEMSFEEDIEKNADNDAFSERDKIFQKSKSNTDVSIDFKNSAMKFDSNNIHRSNPSSILKNILTSSNTDMIDMQDDSNLSCTSSTIEDVVRNIKKEIIDVPDKLETANSANSNGLNLCKISNDVKTVIVTSNNDSHKVNCKVGPTQDIKQEIPDALDIQTTISELSMQENNLNNAQNVRQKHLSNAVETQNTFELQLEKTKILASSNSSDDIDVSHVQRKTDALNSKEMESSFPNEDISVKNSSNSFQSAALNTVCTKVNFENNLGAENFLADSTSESTNTLLSISSSELTPTKSRNSSKKKRRKKSFGWYKKKKPKESTKSPIKNQLVIAENTLQNDVSSIVKEPIVLIENGKVNDNAVFSQATKKCKKSVHNDNKTNKSDLTKPLDIKNVSKIDTLNTENSNIDTPDDQIYKDISIDREPKSKKPKTDFHTDHKINSSDLNKTKSTSEAESVNQADLQFATENGVNNADESNALTNNDVTIGQVRKSPKKRKRAVKTKKISKSNSNEQKSENGKVDEIEPEVNDTVVVTQRQKSSKSKKGGANKIKQADLIEPKSVSLETDKGNKIELLLDAENSIDSVSEEDLPLEIIRKNNQTLNKVNENVNNVVESTEEPFNSIDVVQLRKEMVGLEALCKSLNSFTHFPVDNNVKCVEQPPLNINMNLSTNENSVSTSSTNIQEAVGILESPILDTSVLVKKEKLENFLSNNVINASKANNLSSTQKIVSDNIVSSPSSDCITSNQGIIEMKSQLQVSKKCEPNVSSNSVDEEIVVLAENESFSQKDIETVDLTCSPERNSQIRDIDEEIYLRSDKDILCKSLKNETEIHSQLKSEVSMTQTSSIKALENKYDALSSTQSFFDDSYQNILESNVDKYCELQRKSVVSPKVVDASIFNHKYITEYKKYPFPPPLDLCSKRKNKMYARGCRLGWNLSIKDVERRMRQSQENCCDREVNHDGQGLSTYQVHSNEVKCYHRILGVAPSQKLIKCSKSSNKIVEPLSVNKCNTLTEFGAPLNNINTENDEFTNRMMSLIKEIYQIKNFDSDLQYETFERDCPSTGTRLSSDSHFSSISERQFKNSNDDASSVNIPVTDIENVNSNISSTPSVAFNDLNKLVLPSKEVLDQILKESEHANQSHSIDKQNSCSSLILDKFDSDQEKTHNSALETDQITPGVYGPCTISSEPSVHSSVQFSDKSIAVACNVISRMEKEDLTNIIKLASNMNCDFIKNSNTGVNNDTFHCSQAQSMTLKDSLISEKDPRLHRSNCLTKTDLVKIVSNKDILSTDVSDNGSDFDNSKDFDNDTSVDDRSEDSDSENISASKQTEESPTVVQYKSKWEKIMERKSLEKNEVNKVNEFLLKDCIPVSAELKQKYKGKVPVKSLDKASGKINTSRETEKNQNIKETVMLQRKVKNSENMKNIKSGEVKKTESLQTEKEKVEKNQDKRQNVNSNNKNKTFNKKDKIVNDTSTLFKPDNNVSNISPKDPRLKKGFLNKRFYGNRVTNRGTFLTDSTSYDAMKKLKIPKKKEVLPKKTSSDTQSELFHTMVKSPEIDIGKSSSYTKSSSSTLHHKTDPRKHMLLNPHKSVLSAVYPETNNEPHWRNTSNSVPNVSSSSYTRPRKSTGLLPTPEKRDPRLRSKKSLLATPAARKLIDNSWSDPSLFQTNASGLITILPNPQIIEMPLTPNASAEFHIGTSSNLTSQDLLPLPTQAASSNPVPPILSKKKSCVCLAPSDLKLEVGKSAIQTSNVQLLILEWSVNWLEQQLKTRDPPPIAKPLKKVVNTYSTFDHYYNTYFPLLLLETWHRMFVSWKDKIAQNRHAPVNPLSCRISSLSVKTTHIVVQCHGIYDSINHSRAMFPDKGSILVVTFETKKKEFSIKILGYTTNVKSRKYNPRTDSTSCDYQLPKEGIVHAQFVTLTFMCAYNSEDFDTKANVRIHVLSSVKSTLKQNDAMLYIIKSPMNKVILNPVKNGLLSVDLIPRNAPPEQVDECVREILKGVISPHPLPLLTIVRTLPISDRLNIIPLLIEKVKTVYKYKVLLCVRTIKSLNEIAFNVKSYPSVKMVIVNKKCDTNTHLHDCLLDELGHQKMKSLGKSHVKSEALVNVKKDILKECDVIVSLIRNSHDDIIAEALREKDCIAKLCCIIDEANLCTEPETLIPILHGISKLILIGDPNYNARVLSPTAAEQNYSVSLFHRAYDLELLRQ